MDNFLKELTVEMLPDGLWRQIAEAIGVENFYKLAEVIGGATIYIPQAESITRPRSAGSGNSSAPCPLPVGAETVASFLHPCR